MTKEEIIEEIKSYGDPQTKKTFLNHGAQEPFYGVKVGDLKKIVKKVKKNHELSIALYETGIGDAMYLAGLIADEDQITEKHLQNWVENASWYMISEYTVPWIAAESKFGWKLGLKWIDSDQAKIQSSGWSTLSNYISITSNDELDIKSIQQLLQRVENEIHQSANRVRYVMNAFVISVGSYIPELTEEAMTVAKSVGKVSVDMGGTACKVPAADVYIKKVVDKGYLGKKKKNGPLLGLIPQKA